MKDCTRLMNIEVVGHEYEPLVQPIYQTSLFRMPSYQTAVATEHKVHPSSYYTRWGNPTVSYLENQLSLLMHKERSLIFPSGMSAITTTLFALVKPGDVVAIADSLYGDTTRFFLEDFSQWGVVVKVFDPANAQGLEDIAQSSRLSFVYYEALSNPDLKAIDLNGLFRVCKQHNVTSICDSTFVPPYMRQSEVQLADIVIMSLTKYAGGHYSVFGGSISCSTELQEKIWHTQSLYGAAIDPNAAWNISQGLKTLELRLERQSRSALKIAQSLQRHSKVENVIYPMLEGYAHAHLTSAYLSHGGAVVSFIIKGGEATVSKFLESTKVAGLSVSLGGIHSCIEHAEAMSHSMLKAMDEEVLSSSKAGQPDKALIRLSVGIEDADDLETDLLNALELI